VWVFSPSITGLVGYQKGDSAAWKALFANGSDSYVYWNAGLVLGVEAISFDIRYWDTNVSNANGFCTGAVFQCDSTVVFTAKVALP
jgi:hypothetical protein